MEFKHTILKDNEAIELGSIVLAFIGDAVYSLFVREKLAIETNKKSGELNKETSKIVCASAQAESVLNLLDELDETELGVYRRARNSKKPSKSKHSTISEYNKSTGYEALIGFLYLTGKEERLNNLLNKGVGKAEV